MLWLEDWYRFVEEEEERTALVPKGCKKTKFNTTRQGYLKKKKAPETGDEKRIKIKQQATWDCKAVPVKLQNEEEEQNVKLIKITIGKKPKQATEELSPETGLPLKSRYKPSWPSSKERKRQDRMGKPDRVKGSWIHGAKELSDLAKMKGLYEALAD